MELCVKGLDFFLKLFQQHDQISRVWHRRGTGIVVVLLAVLLPLFGVPFVLTELSLWGRATVAAIAGFLAWPVWYLTSRLPKAKPGTIGVAVSIVCDDEEQSRRLRNDFVASLRRHSGNWSVDEGAHVLELPAWVAESLEKTRNDEDFRDQAGVIAEGTRCRFLLTARATLRDDGEPIHFLRMRGLVRHAPIQVDDSEKLAREFTDVLPSELTVSLENDFRQFESHAKHLDFTARYVTGIAAGLSNDFVFAERQLSDLVLMLTNERAPDSTMAKLRRRAELQLQRCCDAYNTQLLHRYRRSRDVRAIEELERRLLALPAKLQERFHNQMNLALADFVLRCDVPAARERLIRIKEPRSPEWRFSMAFIDAFEGDLQSAYRHYRAIERMGIDGALAVSIEEFIQIVLDEHTEKKQLLFLTGMINRVFKNDVQAARRDLRGFKQWSRRKPEFRDQVAAADKWLDELKHQRA